LRRPVILILLLVAGTVLGNFGLQKTNAVSTPTLTKGVSPTVLSDPAIFSIIGFVGGWNSSTGALCSPSGTANCNPGLTQFRGVTFNVTVIWGDCCPHDFAIYTGGTPPGSVSSLDACAPTSTSGCLAKSIQISSARLSVPFSFKPTIPADDFTGLGTYEYYCQFHPSSMHGTATVYKSPDLDRDKTVDIVDVATVAFSFGSSALPSPTPTWNVAADLNNDGHVNILDVAFVAFYFGRPL
jgi:plastocyanin